MRLICRLCGFRIAIVLTFLLAIHGVRAGGEEWSLDGHKKQRIDALFDKWNTEMSPGAAIGISQRGKLVFARGYGAADLDHAVPVRPDSVFYIASTSKQFTAAAIAILSLNGTVALDDDIRKWLPEFPASASPITVRHLIHHTSGIRDYGLLRLMQGRTFNEYFDNDGTVALLARQQAGNFIPGSQFRYCNSNYVLLAEILERASGMTCQEYTQKHIFKPLGMDSTLWGLAPRRVLPGRVTSYLRLDHSSELLRFDVNFSGHGDGNLWTSVEDLVRWDGNFYEPKVGGKDLIRLLLTRGRLSNGARLDYAFGLSFGRYKGLRTVSHAGGLFGYGSEVMRFPDEGLCVIVLANLGSIDSSASAKRIADIVLDLSSDSSVKDVTETSTGHIPNDLLGSYVGEFYQGDCGRLLKVSSDAGRLTLHGLGQPMPLRKIGTNKFESPDGPAIVTFETADVAPAQAMLLKSPTAVDPARLTRLQRSPVDSNTLETFAGRYRSNELQTDWILDVRNANLSVRLMNKTIHLEPLDHDRFQSDRFDVAFRRDAEKNILGLTVVSEGASGILFDRVTH